MADKKISELNTATTIYDADDLAVVQDGETKQANASTVKAYVKDGLSKSDVGLGNVDNTSDANKPVSTATQTALNLKQNAASAATLTGTQTLTNKTLTSPAISGGTADSVTIGGTTPAAGTFTTLGATGNTTLGDASTDTVTVNGYMGVGGAATASQGIAVGSTALTGASQYGGAFYPTVTSAASTAGGIFSQVQTAAATFTVINGFGIQLANATKGAGSTIINLHGLYIADQTQGTNNYGITSLVSSGANKWNIYASGTANNYFAGNVGIGTSTPAARLDIAGGNLLLRQSSNAANTSVSFNTTVQNALTLDASGNLGLGVAPSAWQSASKAFQINTIGSLFAFSNDVQLGSNTVFSSTGSTYRYITTAAASRYAQTAGAHQWFAAPSGTAGAAITFTQAMTLTPKGLLVGYTSDTSLSGTDNAIFSGNVGIGTSSPRAKLDVAGDVAFSWATGTALQVIGNTAYNGSLFVNTPSVNIEYSSGLAIDGSYPAGLGNVGRSIINIKAVGVNFAVNGYGSDLAFHTSSGASLTEKMRLDASGNLGLGAIIFGTSATKTLALSTGTAPSTGPADTIQIYSTDLSAGNTMLSIFTEGTPVNANTTAAATHRIAIRINGTVYYLLANTAA